MLGSCWLPIPQGPPCPSHHLHDLAGEKGQPQVSAQCPGVQGSEGSSSFEGSDLRSQRMLCFSQQQQCHSRCIQNGHTGDQAVSARKTIMCTRWVDPLILYWMKRNQLNSSKIYHFCYFSLCFLFNPLEYAWKSRITREREDKKRQRQWIKEVDSGKNHFLKYICVAILIIEFKKSF